MGTKPLPPTTHDRTSYVHDALALRLSRERVRRGDRVHVQPDAVLVCSAYARALLDGALAAEAPDAHRYCCPYDAGRTFDADAQVLWQRTLARGFGLVPDPSQPGSGAHALFERGWIGSHALVCGDDPGLFAVGGVGGLAWVLDQDALGALATEGASLVQVPRTRRVSIGGFAPRWTGPHDLALALRRPLLDAVGEDGVLPVVHELVGAAIEAACVPGRIALCEALGRMGLWAVVPPDEKTLTWLRARCRDARLVHPGTVALGEGHDDAQLSLRAEAARPRALVLEADGRAVVHNVEDHEPLPVREVVLGATDEQLRVGVETLRDRRVAPGVALRVVPVTQRTLLHAVEEGLLAELLRAGAVVTAPGDVPPPGAPGRLVTRHARAGDVLVSAAVAAASAVVGRLIDPETMRREVRRTGRRL